MPTLLISTWSLPGANGLAVAAGAAGWRACALDENPALTPRDDIVFYGGADVALRAAARFDLALIEPPLDLLARLPQSFLLRKVECRMFSALHRLTGPAFVKPADPLNKAFDPGIYAHAGDIRTPKPVPPDTQVLVAEPVSWLMEYRCFIREGEVVATSPYLNYGRPVWQPHGAGRPPARESASVLTFCQRLLTRAPAPFPPAFVADIGLIEDRGWAVVEFNPAWCAGLLGADPRRVLAVLRRACQNRASLSSADRRWLIPRKGRER